MDERIDTCLKSSLARQKCETCGKNAAPVHIPTLHVGYFCADCCPVCTKKKA